MDIGWLLKSKLTTFDAPAAKDASKPALLVFWNGLRNTPSLQIQAVVQHV
jgi:hypothetical protein